MNRKKLFTFLAVFMLAILGSVPNYAYAGLVPCGGTGQAKCSLCHIVSGIGDLTTYIRDIMVFVALAIITAMGIMYIVSAGNTGMMETAKKGVWAALAGVAIVLFAWVIVNTIMYTIFRVQEGEVGVLKNFSFTTGFVFDCDATLAGVGSVPAGAVGAAPGAAPGAGATPVAGVPAIPGGALPADPVSPSPVAKSVLCGADSLAVNSKTSLRVWTSPSGSAIGCSDTSGAIDATAEASDWKSSDDARATVQAGEVTAKNKLGNVDISTTTPTGSILKKTILIYPNAVENGVFGICQNGPSPIPVGSTAQLSVWRQASGMVNCNSLAEAQDVTKSCKFSLEKKDNARYITLTAAGKVTAKDGPSAVTVVATCPIPGGSKTATTSVLTTK